MKRFLIALVLLLCATVTNFVFVVRTETSKKYDITYLHTYCEPTKAIPLTDLPGHITYDRSIDGAIYIFNTDISSYSEDDFEAAFRTSLSEFLCVPLVGCATVPFLSKECH